MSDDFRDHRIIEGRHLVTGVNVSINSHAGPAGKIEGRNTSGRGGKGLRVFRVDTALDCVSHNHQVVLCVTQGLAFSDPHLIAHDVRQRHHLRHRMLDLNASVHLHEVIVVLRIEQELERAGTRITDLLTCSDCGCAHFRPQFMRQHSRWCFLQKLLMPSLNRAFSFTQVDTIAVFVSHHLDLDVSWLINKAFNINAAVFKGRGRFGGSSFQR